MAVTIEDLGAHMAAGVKGIDLNRSVDAASRDRLRRALIEKQVLCIHGQELTPKAYRDAMCIFGKPVARDQTTQHPEVPEISILSSEERDTLGDGRRLIAGAYWHTDDSFRAEPCSITMLYGVEVPPIGGDTQFANMYAAYSDLGPNTKQRIERLQVVHMYQSSRNVNPVPTLSASKMGKLPPVAHPLVTTHPESGRKALYMNPNRMEQIVGMPREESDGLLDELIAHATQAQYQYRHKWRRGDILIWDNRCLMHKANADYPASARRVMHRIIIEGAAPMM